MTTEAARRRARELSPFGSTTSAKQQLDSAAARQRAKDLFVAAVEAEMARGCSRLEAIQRVARRDPQLRLDYIKSTNKASAVIDL